jgi:O-antigen/teichoic acid export membrane protein
LPFYYFAIIAAKAGLMIWFLWQWGVMGVIFSLIIGYAIESAVLYWGIRKDFQFGFNPIKIIVVPVLFGVMVLAIEPFFGKQFPFFTHFGYLIMSGVLLLWAFKNELKNLDWRNLIK